MFLKLILTTLTLLIFTMIMHECYKKEDDEKYQVIKLSIAIIFAFLLVALFVFVIAGVWFGFA